MIKTVLFDFDGTVYDTVEGITRSVQYALRRQGREAELSALRCYAGPPLQYSFMHYAGLSEEAALRAATYFRGGMQMGSVCGAVTGALMALGFAGVDDAAAANELIRKVKENHEGLINCKDLLRVSAQRGEIKKAHCDAMIRECIGYAEEILREKDALR